MQFDSLKLSRLAFAVVNHAAHVSRGDDGKKNEPQMSSRLVDLSLQDTILPLFSFLCLLFSAYQAIFNQWIAAAEHVSVYMPEDSCCESVSHLQKKKASPSFTWNNGPWNHWGQPCCFSGRRDGPSKPIDWRRSRVAPLLCETQNTQWRGGTMQGGTSFTLFFFFLRHPLFQGVGGGGGAWGDSYPPEKTGELCEKVQLVVVLLLRPPLVPQSSRY